MAPSLLFLLLACTFGVDLNLINLINFMQMVILNVAFGCMLQYNMACTSDLDSQ